VEDNVAAMVIVRKTILMAGMLTRQQVTGAMALKDRSTAQLTGDV